MRAFALVLAIVLSAASTAAIQRDVDLTAVNDALTMGRSGAAARTRFHEAYRVMGAAAPIDYLDVVTPFRRIVIAAESSAAAGDRRFGQRQSLEILRASADSLEIYVELTFHPLNTYVGVPSFDVALVPRRGQPLRAVDVDRLPRWTPRVDRYPLPGTTSGATAGSPQGQPLLGGTLVARWDLRNIDDRGAYEVVVRDASGEAGRAAIDLGRMR